MAVEERVTAGILSIGREIVRAFSVQGATVFVCDIDGSGLDTLAQEISWVGDKGLRHLETR